LVSQQLITEGDHLLWMNTTAVWKQMRKLIHQDLTESMCNKQHGRLQHAESVQMLNDMMDDPDQWKRHLSRFSNSVILSISALYALAEIMVNVADKDLQFMAFVRQPLTHHT
jgi:uncharacterized protein (UPF0147 family)